MMMHVEKLHANSGKRAGQSPLEWMPDGRGFVIRSKERVVNDILPQFFPKTKFSSFTRKLYRWGFRQVVIPGGGETRELFFGNEYFQRDQKHLLKKMRSTTAAGLRRQQAQQCAHGAGEPFAMSSVAALAMPPHGELGSMLPAPYSIAAAPQPSGLHGVFDARQSTALINPADFLSHRSGSHSANAPLTAALAQSLYSQQQSMYSQQQAALLNLLQSGGTSDFAPYLAGVSGFFPSSGVTTNQYLEIPQPTPISTMDYASIHPTESSSVSFSSHQPYQHHQNTAASADQLAPQGFASPAAPAHAATFSGPHAQHQPISADSTSDHFLRLMNFCSQQQGFPSSSAVVPGADPGGTLGKSQEDKDSSDSSDRIDNG
jgi:HSF-type DNA-binding